MKGALNGRFWVGFLFGAVFFSGVAFFFVVRRSELSPPEPEPTPAVRCRAECTLSGMRVHSVDPFYRGLGLCRCEELP